MTRYSLFIAADQPGVSIERRHIGELVDAQEQDVLRAMKKDGFCKAHTTDENGEPIRCVIIETDERIVLDPDALSAAANEYLKGAH